MTTLTDFLKTNAYYGTTEKLKLVDITKILDPKQLVLIGQGMNARAYKIPNSNWVVKEGRWDLDMTFFANLKVKFPAGITQEFLEKFNFSFLPIKEEIIRQYQLYQTFYTYYGYFDTDSSYFHPQKEKIFRKQQQIRQDLKASQDEVSKKFFIRKQNQLGNLLNKSCITHNFVPDEYLLYGNSISEVNQGKPTYFIFQQFIQGELFHDVSMKDMSQPILKQSAIFAYISLFLSMTQKLIPDLRPRNVISEVHDWFGKTDNLSVAEEGVYMIDTRWMWSLDDNIVKRGGVIPEQIILSTRNYLNKALKEIT